MFPFLLNIFCPMAKTEIFENNRATGYNRFVQRWIPNYDYFLSRIPALLREVSNKELLVAGCGTGNEIAYFLEKDQQWKITGVDPSPQMIAQAKEKLADCVNVELVEGLVSDLDETIVYGAATLLLVLHFMPDDGTKLNLLKDIAKRLSPNAPLILLDITGGGQAFQNNLDVLRRLLPVDEDPEEIANRLDRIQHKLHPVSEARLIALIEAAGFSRPNRFFQTAIYQGWEMRKL